MPWTPAQENSHRANRRRNRRSNMASRRLWEIKAVATIATLALEGALPPLNGVDEKTGLHSTDDGWKNKSQQRIRLREESSRPYKSTSIIPRKGYTKVVGRLGWRVARYLAFSTPYFSLPCSMPHDAEEEGIALIVDADELQKYL